MDIHGPVCVIFSIHESEMHAITGNMLVASNIAFKFKGKIPSNGGGGSTFTYIYIFVVSLYYLLQL